MLSPFKRSLALGAFAVASLAAAANAQVFTENFDTYALGPIEGNVNPAGPTWHGWGGSNTYIHQVSNLQASSGPQSALLLIGGDTVANFDDITGGNPMVSGQWRMTVDAFIPTGFDGTTYYIGMNSYDDPGTLLEWSIQVAMDGVFGTPRSLCDCGTAGSVVTNLAFDTWTELRWDIDLDADWVDFYVGGVLQAGYEWSKGVFGGDAYASLSLNALDLYPGTAATTGVDVFFDNIVITSISGPTEPGFQYCPGDGIAPHTPCPCGNDNDGSMSGCSWSNAGGSAGATLTATGDADIANQDVYLTATNVENNFGIFFGANNQTNAGNGNVFGDGLRCAGGALVRLTAPTMATGNMATHGPIEVSDTGAAAGVTRRYQYWFRTPGGPCATVFNLSNGYEIAWM